MLKFKYETILSNSELLSGLINIGTDSNHYWYNQSGLVTTKSSEEQTIEETPIEAEKQPLYIIVAADCLGYIFGWAGAVFRESSSPGGLKKENQWNRVGEGVVSALQYSSVGLLALNEVPVDEPVEESADEPEDAISKYLDMIED